MLTSDHDIFEGLSLADRQQHTIGQLQRFLSFTKPVVQASMSQAHELAIQQQRPITAFFDIMEQDPTDRRRRRVMRAITNQQGVGRRSQNSASVG